MATTLDREFGGRTAAPSRANTGTTSMDFAWHAYAVVAAATMVLVGLLWDISWHMSIGRDTFWTPAHLLIQAGGLTAGLGSGALALFITLRGTAEQKASTVSFWGFRAPFGAWVCIWGCGAMLTSAPFDDWWHNAYGLDVRIVSPPHLVLGFGMLGILLGALLRALALQNVADDARRARAAALFAAASGLVLTIVAVFCFEWSDPNAMHGGLFYRTLAIPMPFLLVTVAVAGRGRWSATTAAVVYMLALAVTSWILMLFPATPKLGPIYQNITHYVPLNFPLLLVAPALAIDLTLRRIRGWSTWRAAPVLAAAFVVAFVVVQWPFADVLMNAGRNWFLHADNFVYWQSHASEAWVFTWQTPRPGEPSLVVYLAYALLFATLSSAAGLGWGRWMTRVRR
ncbi:MAG: hypothetical protein ABJE47_04530 [bacterium]